MRAGIDRNPDMVVQRDFVCQIMCGVARPHGDMRRQSFGQCDGVGDGVKE